MSTAERQKRAGGLEGRAGGRRAGGRRTGGRRAGEDSLDKYLTFIWIMTGSLMCIVDHITITNT